MWADEEAATLFRAWEDEQSQQQLDGINAISNANMSFCRLPLILACALPFTHEHLRPGPCLLLV